MGLNVAMYIALSGLFANQRAIAATSENIANVNTENFSRREVQFLADALPDQFAGVSTEITRAAADRFLQTASYGARADASAASLAADALGRVEASLGGLADNISFAHTTDAAFASLITLSANPSSVAAKNDALMALDDAFASFARTQNAVDAESDAALGRLDGAIDRANALLGEIYRLNQIVPDSNGAADLLDTRLAELSELLPISVARGDDGRVIVSSGGEVIADSADYLELSVAGGPPTALSASRIDGDTGGATALAQDFTGLFATGEIAALVDLRNTSLPALATLVVDTARALATELNSVYAANAGIGAIANSGRALIVEANNRFSVNDALLDDPATFEIARPAAGSPGGANDGTGAAALAGVTNSAAARALPEAIARIGAEARNAELAAQTASAIATEITARASDASGVNLDEELSNLIIFQRSYSANARVIAAVDELWESLLSIL